MGVGSCVPRFHWYDCWSLLNFWCRTLQQGGIQFFLRCSSPFLQKFSVEIAWFTTFSYWPLLYARTMIAFSKQKISQTLVNKKVSNLLKEIWGEKKKNISCQSLTFFTFLFFPCAHYFVANIFIFRLYFIWLRSNK